METSKTILAKRREDKAWKYATLIVFSMWLGLIVSKLIGLIINTWTI